MKTHNMGTIILDETTRVTDPGYKYDTNNTAFSNIILHTQPGQYKCTAYEMEKGLWKKRIVRLRINHANETIDEKKQRKRLVWECCFSVDSGQAGFFNEKYFKKKSKTDKWYSKICNTTLSDRQSGCIENACAICRTGLGDGLYDCFVHRNAEGRITIAELRFR